MSHENHQKLGLYEQAGKLGRQFAQKGVKPTLVEQAGKFNTVLKMSVKTGIGSSLFKRFDEFALGIASEISGEQFVRKQDGTVKRYSHPVILSPKGEESQRQRSFADAQDDKLEMWQLILKATERRADVVQDKPHEPEVSAAPVQDAREFTSMPEVIQLGPAQLTGEPVDVASLSEVDQLLWEDTKYLAIPDPVTFSSEEFAKEIYRQVENRFIVLGFQHPSQFQSIGPRDNYEYWAYSANFEIEARELPKDRVEMERAVRSYAAGLESLFLRQAGLERLNTLLKATTFPSMEEIFQLDPKELSQKIAASLKDRTAEGAQAFLNVPGGKTYLPFQGRRPLGDYELLTRVLERKVDDEVKMILEGNSELDFEYIWRLEEYMSHAMFHDRDAIGDIIDKLQFSTIIAAQKLVQEADAQRKIDERVEVEDRVGVESEVELIDE